MPGVSRRALPRRRGWPAPSTDPHGEAQPRLPRVVDYDPPSSRHSVWADLLAGLRRSRRRFRSSRLAAASSPARWSDKKGTSHAAIPHLRDRLLTGIVASGLPEVGEVRCDPDGPRRRISAKTAREGFDRACPTARGVVVSGLTAVEKTSAGLREKLAFDPARRVTPPSPNPPVRSRPRPRREPKATKPKARRTRARAAKAGGGGVMNDARPRPRREEGRIGTVFACGFGDQG